MAELRDPGPLPVFPPPPVPSKPTVHRIDAQAAARLLALARNSREAVRRAIEKGGRADASEAERKTAALAQGCMNDLVRRLPDLDRAISGLEALSTGTSTTMIDLAQVAAIEAFADCAAPILHQASMPERALTVAAGVGLPAALSILLSLLRT
jgi:hypothetical protein